MEIGNYVSQQLLAFLRAIALGACLGLEYDVLGALRRLGGKVWGGVLDAAFCLTAASASAARRIHKDPTPARPIIHVSRLQAGRPVACA